MTVLRPMQEPEYEAWRVNAIAAYAADKVASGQWAAAASTALAAQEHAELLPQGIATPNHHFLTIEDDQGTPVGMLWFAEEARSDARIAYVYNVEIDPDRRRQGHAARAFAALESEVRRRGLTGIALHVFGHNRGAQALYAGLGFEPTNISLFKRVDATGA